MSQVNPTDIEADAYARHYVEHGDKTKAFRAAFPNSKAKPQVASVQASRLHDAPKVRLRIEELNAIAREKADKDHGMTVDRLISMSADVYTEGMKKRIEGIERPDGAPTNLAASNQALSNIGRWIGADKSSIDVKHSGNITDLTDEQEKILKRAVDDEY